MKRLLIAALVAAPLLLLATPAHAQNDPEAKLLFGYSFLRASLNDAAAGDAHGGELAYTYYLDRHVGFTVSAAAGWGTVPAPPNVFVVGRFDLQQITLMAGPTLVIRRGITTDIEFSVLGGAVRRELEVPGFGTRIADDWDPIFGARLSFDLRLSDSIWLRAAQPELLLTRFGDEWGTDFRIGVGLVIRSGEIIS